MAKLRLDNLLVARGLAESRSKAQALIMAGSVRVAGQPAPKAGSLVDEDAQLEVTAALPYASRGGYKLAHALDRFGLDPRGLTALDAGASTGGFTDVLLQRGAARVYAVDVGYGILDYRLRADPRVIALERTNIRYLEALPRIKPEAERGSGEDALNAHAPDSPVLAACAVVDVSFISLRLVLPAVRRLTAPGAWTVALIKPQFEAGPEQVSKGGVVRDPSVHRAVLREVLACAAELGMPPRGIERSPITGPAGNVEFLAWLQPGAAPCAAEAMISAIWNTKP